MRMRGVTDSTAAAGHVLRRVSRVRYTRKGTRCPMTELRLTEQERDLLLEILERQQRELSLETRRTESIRMHEEMRERVRTVDRLVERLTEAAPRARRCTPADT